MGEIDDVSPLLMLQKSGDHQLKLDFLSHDLQGFSTILGDDRRISGCHQQYHTEAYPTKSPGNKSLNFSGFL